MLVLGRKLNETVLIDGRIIVQVVKFKGGHVRLGIDADPSIPILRGELADDGRPSRPPAPPDAYTEVGRLRAELEKVNRLDAAMVSELSEKLRVCEALSAARAGVIRELRDDLFAAEHALEVATDELAGLRAERSGR